MLEKGTSFQLSSCWWRQLGSWSSVDLPVIYDRIYTSKRWLAKPDFWTINPIGSIGRNVYLPTYMKGQFSMVQFSCRFSYTKLVPWESSRVLVLPKIGSFSPVTLIFELWWRANLPRNRGAPVPPGSVLTAGPRVSWMGHEWIDGIDDGC